MRREVTPSVTRAGVPSGGIQKLWCGVKNYKLGPSAGGTPEIINFDPKEDTNLDTPENTNEYFLV